MSVTYTKLLLGGSVNGKQILLTTSSSTSPTSIHTAVNNTTDFDEIYLYAYNDATASLSCSILWGGTTEPNDVIRVTLPSKSGRTLIADGKLLQNSLIVQGYAQLGNFVSVDGFVNRITNTADIDLVVSAWATKVIQAGGSGPSTSSMLNMTSFYRNLVTYGLDKKMLLVNCIAPDSSTASLVPLIDNFNTFNYNPGHRWIPVSITTNTSASLVNGISGSGGSSYYSTSFNAGSSYFNTSSCGVTFYAPVIHQGSNAYDFGITDNLGNAAFSVRLNDTGITRFSMWDLTTGQMTASFAGIGYYSGNRISNTDARIYYANSTSSHAQVGPTLTTNTNNASLNSTLVTQICMVGAVTQRDSGLVPFGSSNNQYSFIAVHLGLTAFESQIFFNLIQSLRINFGGGYV